ncbi:MAG: aldose 1-epimerase [Betaproteobacteria bacterium]
MSTAMPTLKQGEAEVVVSPRFGGALAYFRWRGNDILRPAPPFVISAESGWLPVRKMACYPLVPYSNRIAHAELPEGGRLYKLRANAPPEIHSLHGFGWQRAWSIAAQSSNSIELRLAHPADDDWPFACDVSQHIALLPGDIGASLRVDLSIRNTGDIAMPTGLGLHPYFPIDSSTRFQARCRDMWLMSADMLPTDLVPISAADDFSEMREISGWRVDNCFTGWNGSARLQYASHVVEMQAGDSCRQLVCFAPNDGRNFIALEPVTNVNNAFALAASGVADTGVCRLSPGESLAMSMSIKVAPR